MFYSLIKKKRDRWYNSSECTVKELIEYMTNANKLRDVQIDAIKTYLFLKIKCNNKPLWELFYEGVFNTLDVSSLEIAQASRDYFVENPCALALYQYATTKNDKGEQVSIKLEKEIKQHFDRINYKQVFQDIFYGVNYTDYLFSLPMGAGKTYLMACFIYLDLYFALNEPENSNFAHNFIILAPSGLKSSVIPSLKTIQRFNPEWVIPEPTASKLKHIIKFEVLDQGKTASKSNKIKNPNVQKIAIYQPFEELFGLVAVTNAEKVILDRVEKKSDEQQKLMSEEELAKYRASNELRALIGKIPNLSVFIDEVHHATSDSIKLRTVVTDWGQNKTLNSVVGFSGTPYLEKADSVVISEELKTQNKEITNVVYYYPLVEGVGNFLKKPVVKISDTSDRLSIVENGLVEFFNAYKDTVYSDGTKAKIGIYCGSIENLEEQIYPLCCNIASKYELNPDETILKFHKGNKEYPEPVNSDKEFAMLDSDMSKIRIVLLVQIGKEGWDCKSLTGIILSQEGDCPTNMVLQTSCRCLRQVDKTNEETALIYLNKSNADKLKVQLEKQHHIGLQEFQNGRKKEPDLLNRYNRMDKQKVPPIDFYQMRVEYNTVIVEKSDPSKIVNVADNEARSEAIMEQDFMTGEIVSYDPNTTERGDIVANFNIWLHSIVKGSYNTLSYSTLKQYESELRQIFDKITYVKDGIKYFSSKFNTQNIEANIRKVFADVRDIQTKEELIKKSASLLVVEKLTSPIETFNKERFTPNSDVVETIINEDSAKALTDEEHKIVEMLKKSGNIEMAKTLENKAVITHPEKDKTYHYLPYKTDSNFEMSYLKNLLALKVFNDNNLEVYYNGDETLTDFTLKTYKKGANGWKYIGKYTPDFLIIKRNNDEIDRVMIVETKGNAFADKFKDKKEFMKEFVRQNNEKFKYNRFDFLYLQDDWSSEKIIYETTKHIEEFFKGVC